MNPTSETQAETVARNARLIADVDRIVGVMDTQKKALALLQQQNGPFNVKVKDLINQIEARNTDLANKIAALGGAVPVPVQPKPVVVKPYVSHGPRR